MERFLFQFPPPRGGERPPHFVGAKLKISIPAPARGRTAARIAAGDSASYFNSRPREGANIVSYKGKLYRSFQFPPPRGGEQALNNVYAVFIEISIPAPARGRT